MSGHQLVASDFVPGKAFKCRVGMGCFTTGNVYTVDENGRMFDDDGDAWPLGAGSTPQSLFEPIEIKEKEMSGKIEIAQLKQNADAGENSWYIARREGPNSYVEYMRVDGEWFRHMNSGDDLDAPGGTYFSTKTAAEFSLAMDAPSKVETAADILADASKTFGERHKVYGDNYKKVGGVMAALFPDGLSLRSVDDHNRFHIFMLQVVKLTRYVENWDRGGHDDSSLDLSVYAAMLASIDREINGRGE